MNAFSKAVLVGISALALPVSSASAEIVCNAEGDCWHAKMHADYRPEFKLHVHPDNWKWGGDEGRSHRWHEHEGHGYWRSGIWIGL